MKIVYDGIICGKEKEIKEIAFNCGILYDTARLLFCRGIDTVEKAKRFLSPGKYAFNDPYLFKDMEAVVRRITHARENNEKVMIFGDYDADGISATAVLYNSLKIFGITAATVIPEREEGYGVNVAKITEYGEEKPDLVITVDCGISDREKIEELKSLGIEVIVTDHHEPPEILPDCLIINPKVKDSGYPFDGLCGAGVAYKTGYALIGDAADAFLDFVALATVSDSMELVEENRDIVSEGLKILNGDNVRPCFKYLIGDAKTVNSQTLAFSVAPKINAGGRMGDAYSALRLFLSGSVAEISEKAELLKSYNVERQVECENIYREAKTKIAAENTDDGVIAVYGENWNAGFTGIVASRLVEEYSRPVIVFGEINGILKGSARSVDGVNIYNIICSAKDILTSFGGHAQAAGVGVEKENFEELKIRLNEYFKAEYKDYKSEKITHAEWLFKDQMSLRFIKEIELLEPFGVGNKRPVFGVEIKDVLPLPLREGSPHYSFKTEVIDMLDFNGEKDVEILSLPVKKTVLFETNRSVFKNRESIKGFVKEVYADLSDFSPIKDYIVSNELDKLLYAETGKTPIPYDGIELNGKTLYVVSDPNNFGKSGIKSGLNTYLFDAAFSGEDAVAVSPRSIPDGYSDVVYIDRPTVFLKTDVRTYCNFSESGYNFIKDIKTERDDMATFYKEIVAHCGEPFFDPVKFYNEHNFSFGTVNFLFAVKVFTELGIFYIKNGKLTVSGIKSSLTDSRIYNGVRELKKSYE